MKKIFTLLLLFFLTFSFGQVVLLDEDFESYNDFTTNNFGNWTGLDLDQLDTWSLGGDPAPPTNWYPTWPNAGTKMSFQIFNPTTANVSNDEYGTSGEIRNFDSHSGNKYAGCWAGKMVSSGNGNKDWLISPVITLGSSGNNLTLWLKTLSISYGDERYRIGVYLGEGNPTNSSEFIIISNNTSPSEPFLYATGLWKKDTYNLDAFAGSKVRIGIYCLTQEGSMLMVDDVKITTNDIVLSSTENNSNIKINIYPNPTYGIVNLISEEKILNTEIFNAQGQKINTFKSKSFNISGLNNGIYILKINFNESKSKIIKIMKE